jgi:type IV secretory pathway component VirB8
MIILNKTVKDNPWLISMLCLLSLGLALLCCCLIYCICFLLPLKKESIFLLTNKPYTNQIVVLEPIEVNSTSTALMTKKLLMQYVEIRETINPLDYEIRINKQKNFENEITKKNYSLIHTDSIIEAFNKRNITRSVKIISASNIGNSKSNIWQVEWQQEDFDGVNKIVINKGHYFSTIKITLGSQKININKALENPIGLLIEEYNVTKRDLS